MNSRLQAMAGFTLVVAGLSAFPFTVYALDEKPSECSAQQVWIEFLDHKRCYSVGDKAPDPYTREEWKFQDWQKRQLPLPKENAQWVEASDHFLMINRDNSVIMEIRDTQGRKVN